ncbi:MAG TPA: hypothetical protein VMM35_01675 [Longimicrobiales bacterium]|nr:hypothetical protein [Longimicrobiales bacterium]
MIRRAVHAGEPAAGKARSGGSGPPPERGGFVLALVVLMLFAISVASATGYLVVSTEFNMAKHSGQGAEALSVARAGLHRFVSEQLGVVGSSVSYAIGDGVALVTTRRVAQKDSITDVYYIRSEGTLVDPFTPATPARRVVGAYAVHHRRPLRHHGAFMVSATAAYAQNSSGVISGNDASTDPTCPGSGTPPLYGPITGAIAGGTTGALSGGTLEGTPPGEAWGGGFAAAYDSVGLRWDILSDPTFPVDFDGVLPNYGSIPSDSFPVVRVHGYFNPGSSWSGRGLLIVNGELDARSSFVWEGIVLAGSVDDIHEGHIRGMLVAGLDGPNTYSTVYWRGTIRYYSCLVNRANESLSYMELLENTVFEAS